MAGAVDRRRVLGPAESFVPDAPAGAAAPRLSSKRANGRGAEVLRPGATGSCYVEVGETKVMCAVYGPRPPHRAETFQDTGMLECEVTIAPFATTRRRREVRDPAERALAAIVEQALLDSVRLDAYPKLSIAVYLTVLQDDGSVDAAAITCASAALAHGGILLFDTVVACAAGVASGDVILVDCDGKEEPLVNGRVLVAYMPSLHETTGLDSRGQVNVETLIEATEMCIDGCARIRAVVDEALVRGAVADS